MEQSDFYRYLQLRNRECKLAEFSTAENDFYKILTPAFKSIPKKSISKLYNALLDANNNGTLDIKEKREKEGNLWLSDEVWEEICKFQWSSTSSSDWREHCWKNIIQYFKTPYQEKYKDINRTCWRQCGTVEANHFCIFWDCPKLSRFWEGIHRTLNKDFNTHIPLNLENLYFGHINC